VPEAGEVALEYLRLWVVLGDFIEGCYYLFSPSFRRKKRAEWAESSGMTVISEIGLWVVSAVLVFADSSLKCNFD
jgi:hypothetical protein